MPERVQDLRAFLLEMAQLLRLLDQCKEVLFRAGFRQHLSQSIAEASSRLEAFRDDKRLMHPSEYREFDDAGLVGAQLSLKLESFETDLADFRSEADLESLEKALDKGSTILGSLAGAIPGFGSFAQELVDFLLKELRRRIWRRRRDG